MHGAPAVARPELPGSFMCHPGPDTVAEKSERHRHQRLQYMTQSLHKRSHRHEWCLSEPRGTARHLDRAKVDFGRYEAPQWPVKGGIASGVGKTKEPAADHRGFIPIWNPPIECHAPSLISQRSG